MARLMTLDDLQAQFELARDKLSRDRQEILDAAPLPENFSPDEYGFSYLRAERIGIDSIVENLNRVSWLPMRLDPQTEVLLDSKDGMKKWIAKETHKQPTGDDFGNDFVHALARVGIATGWESEAFQAFAIRIGFLFRNLSCLIGLIYYGVWMSENGIIGLPITDPSDLERTAREISITTSSPEVARLLYERRIAHEAEARTAPPKKKDHPHLRVIENTDFVPAPQA